MTERFLGNYQYNTFILYNVQNTLHRSVSGSSLCSLCCINANNVESNLLLDDRRKKTDYFVIIVDVQK